MLIAFFLLADDKKMRDQLMPVAAKIHSANMQKSTTSAKSLQQLQTHYSYSASGSSYEWRGLVPLATSQNTAASRFVQIAQIAQSDKSEKVIQAWVRKGSPDKLLLFLPEKQLNPFVFFFLVCLGIVVMLVSTVAGSGLTLRSVKST